MAVLPTDRRCYLYAGLCIMPLSHAPSIIRILLNHPHLGYTCIMKPIRLVSATEQVSARLRKEILKQRLRGEMPGIQRLAKALLVNHKTVESALAILEEEGLLVRQGAGRCRKIALPKHQAKKRSLRVAMLNYEPTASLSGHTIELLHLLMGAGHSAFFSRQSLTELETLSRVIRHVNATDADAWVVNSGPREVLEWFASQEVPAFAMFGRRRGLRLAAAGPDKPPAYTALTKRLAELGHQRIVLVSRKERRLPSPGASERAFLAALKDHGIPTGSYNLPDWEESASGFHDLMQRLFKSTPPTALIIDDAQFIFATQQFLMNRRLSLPEDVSLICADGNPYFKWCKPAIAHIAWDTRPVIRRVVRWANNVASGKEDYREAIIKTAFLEGGTIGPPKR